MSGEGQAVRKNIGLLNTYWQMMVNFVWEGKKQIQSKEKRLGVKNIAF